MENERYKKLNDFCAWFLYVIKISILFLLFSLPLFTGFASYATVSSVYRNTDPGSSFSQLFNSFAGSFRNKLILFTVCGFFSFLMIIASAVSGSFYYFASENFLMKLVIVLVFSLLIIFCFSYFNVLSIVDCQIDLPMSGILKNSFYFTILRFPTNILLFLVFLLGALLIYLRTFLLFFLPLFVVLFNIMEFKVHTPMIMKYMTMQEEEDRSKI